MRDPIYAIEHSIKVMDLALNEIKKRNIIANNNSNFQESIIEFMILIGIICVFIILGILILVYFYIKRMRRTIETQKLTIEYQNKILYNCKKKIYDQTIIINNQDKKLNNKKYQKCKFWSKLN